MLFRYFDLFLISACTGGDCSSGTSGTVKSPNYPSNYDNDKHVTFPLEVASGSSIELTFTGDINVNAGKENAFIQITFRLKPQSKLHETSEIQTFLHSALIQTSDIHS